MADIERSIKVLLLGEDFNMNKTLTNASRDFDKFSQGVQDVTGPLADLGKKAVMVEAALVAMAVGGFAFAASKASDFNSQFLEITTLIDDTGDSVDQFRGEILEYAQSSVKGLGDIQGAIYSAISAGVSYEDSLKSLADAEQLAVGTKADLEASTKTLVSTLNAYGASSDEAGAYAEILFETVKYGQTTMADLSGKIANVTSIAANSGVSFAELSAAIAATTSAGVKTEATITGLRQTISNIIKPTSQAAAMADELGIEFNAQALEAHGLKGILDSVKEATGGNTEQMAQLFGSVEALNVVMALTGEGAQKFSDTLQKTEEHTGSLADAYEKMAEDVKLQTQQLVNNIDVALINVGDKVLASFEGAPSAMSEVVKSINGAITDGAFDDIFNAIESFAGNFRETMLNIAEISPEALEGVDFTGLIAAFGDLGEEISNIFSNLLSGDLDLSTVDGLRNTIQRLVDLFEGLTNFTTGFIEGIQPMIKVLGKLGESAADASGDGARLAGNLSGLAQTANTAFGYLDILKGVLFAFAATGAVKNLIAIGAAVKTVGAAALGSKAALASLGTVAGSIATTGGLALLGTAFAALLVGADKLGNWLGKKDIFGNLVEQAEESARNVAKIEEEIKGIKALTDEAIELNMKLTAPDPLTKSEIDWIADETKRLFEEAGLDSAVLDFSVMKDGAEEDIKDLVKTVDEATQPKEIPIELQVAEFEAQSREVIAQMQETSAIVQESIKWKAELDIAKVQADAEKVKAAFESISVTMESTGDVLNNLFGLLTDADLSTKSLIKTQLQDESKMRAEAHAMQMQLNEEQLRFMRERIQAMQRGEAMIQIDGQGLQPHLEAFMWEVLAAIQIRVNEEGMDMLMGSQ